MIIYVGYGFDVNDIPDEEWLKIVKNYDTAACLNYTVPIRDASWDWSQYTEEEQLEAALKFIDDNYDSDYAAYLCNIINREEECDIVTQYDNYITFDSIAFIDDCRERVIRVPNKEAFIGLIAKYVNTIPIKFGPVWSGNDWEEPNYFID